ncbi:MAG TPA: type VI secretion system protein TssA [Rhizomicrobium sp.]
MAGDLEALLAPISESAPCGPDLSYALARQQMEQAFHTDVSIDTSGRETKAAEVDWRQIYDGIVAEFALTKDLWLATYLCRAAARAGRLDGVALGAEALAGLLERYWDGVHPRLEDVGIAGRRTPCEPLAHKGAFLDPLLRIPLLKHERHGAFSGEALLALSRDGAAAEAYGSFHLTLQETGDAPLKAAHETLSRIDAALRRADALLMEKGGAEGSVDFKPAYGLLAELRQALVAFYITPAPAAERAAGAPQDAGEAPRGALNSRDDVVRALDAVVDYYRRKEPSSPLLPLLERAKAWVPMPFLDLLADIAPDSLGEARRVLSIRPPT